MCPECVWQVPDGLQQWRLDLAVSRVLEIMEEHTTLTVVTEQVNGPAIDLTSPSWQSVCREVGLQQCTTHVHLGRQDQRHLYSYHMCVFHGVGAFDSCAIFFSSSR